MKLFKIYAYAKEYSTGFEPIICTEQAKDEYLAIIRDNGTEIEFDGVTLTWEEINIVESFKGHEIEMYLLGYRMEKL